MVYNEKDLMREQILDAASIVFGKYGYKKSTMDDIGAAIKKGKTAVYYYFTSKEDIFRAVIEREAGMLGKSIISSTAQGENAINKLTLYIKSRMQTLQNVSIFYDAMKNELFDHLDFMNNVRKNYDQFEVSLVKDIIIQGVKEKSFKVSQPEKAAELIVIILKGLEIPIFLRADLSDVEERISDIINLIVYGLVNPQAGKPT